MLNETCPNTTDNKSEDVVDSGNRGGFIVIYSNLQFTPCLAPKSLPNQELIC